MLSPGLTNIGIRIALILQISKCNARLESGDPVSQKNDSGKEIN